MQDFLSWLGFLLTYAVASYFYKAQQTLETKILFLIWMLLIGVSISYTHPSLATFQSILYASLYPIMAALPLLKKTFFKNSKMKNDLTE